MDDQTFEIEMDPLLRAPRHARRAVGAWLKGLRFPLERLDDLLLVVSELVTNAVIHAETRVRLVIRYNGRRVLTEVFDGDARLPRRVDNPTSFGGRGLLIVEHLSSHWGSETIRGDGKRVWAEITT